MATAILRKPVAQMTLAELEEALAVAEQFFLDNPDLAPEHQEKAIARYNALIERRGHLGMIAEIAARLEPEHGPAEAQRLATMQAEAWRLEAAEAPLSLVGGGGTFSEGGQRMTHSIADLFKAADWGKTKESREILRDGINELVQLRAEKEEIAELQAKLQAAEAQAVVMRQALEEIAQGNIGAVDIPANRGDIFLALEKKAKAALATDAGKAYERMKALEAVVKAAKVIAEELFCETNLGPYENILIQSTRTNRLALIKALDKLGEDRPDA